MTKTMNWPAKAMYIALALALAFSLAAVTIAPSQVDAYSETKWNKVTSPNEDDMVIVQNADVIDFVASADGDYIVAILDGVYAWDGTAWVEGGATGNVEDVLEDGYGDAVFVSEDAGVTWDDFTDEAQEEGIYSPMMVAMAPDNADYVFVTGYADAPLTGNQDAYMVIGSDDGGDDFSDMVFDAIAGAETILCIAVSPEAGDAYNVAVGTDGGGNAFTGSIWRYKVGGTFGGSWVDTTLYQGFDNLLAPTAGTKATTAVVAIAFSRSSMPMTPL